MSAAPCPTCGQRDCSHLVRILGHDRTYAVVLPISDPRDPLAYWQSCVAESGLVAAGVPMLTGEATCNTVSGPVAPAPEVPEHKPAPTPDVGPTVDPEGLANLFSYHPPTPEQIPLYEELRAAGHEFAEAIVDLAPRSRERSTALARVREAVMWANAAIACNPEGSSS